MKMPASREEVERLVKGLHSAGSATDQRIRLRQLAETQHPAAVPHVVRELTNSQEIVRQTAAENLVKMGKTALPEIKKAAGSGDGVTRANMAWALGHNIDPEHAVPLLLGLANDREWEVRRNAIGALGKHGDPQTLPLIVQKIRKTEHPEVRAIAVRALGSFHYPRIVRILNRVLKDPDTDIRWSAIQALSRIRGGPALPGLAQALGDKEKKVREDAAIALFHIVETPTTDEKGHEIRKTLLLVHPHLHEKEDWGVVRQAYLAAIKGTVTKNNARLYVKQLRAVKGKLK